MRVLTREEFRIEKALHLDAILRGAVFIYPTDTIYGLGCNATNDKAVKKIREIKKRPESPFSVIAPSKRWIEENCVVDEKAREWIEKLPGPYTLILKLKNKNCIAKKVIPETSSLGVRIPDHWFSRFVEELGVPIVTTSVNEAGKRFMTSAEDIDLENKSEIHFMIDEGGKKGMPSNIIHLGGEEVIVRERQKGAKFSELKKI